MASIVVDYNEKTNKFVITSPPWEVNRMRAIPNRRWESKIRAWVAPNLRANVEYLIKAFGQGSFTDSAMKAVAVRTKSAEPANTRRFPHDYPFKIAPMPHQRSGMDFAYGKKATALFMDPRTGKTKIIIDVACARAMGGEIDMLVVACPNSLKLNWAIEFTNNSPIGASVLVLDTSKKKKFDQWLKNEHPFKVLIHAIESLAAGSAAGLVKQAVASAKSAMVAVDESHLIKGHSSIRSEKAVEIGELAEYRAILTGTPTANTLMDYFMQFQFLDPDIIGIGDFYSFKSRYAVMGGFGGKEIIGYQNSDELMELIAPHVYKVKRADVFADLPPKEYEVRELRMGPEQKLLYESLRKTKKAIVHGDKSEVTNALTLMGRLQEITAGVFSYDNPAYDGTPGVSKYLQRQIDGGNAKIDELLKICEEESGSIIIWARFTIEVAAIAGALRAKYGSESVVEVHGGISPEQRDHNVRNLFQTKTARFLVGNAATGAAGHEMSAAETMVYMSNTFSYTDRVQSEDRASSAKQKNTVKIIDIVFEGTVDEIVTEALRNKQDLSDYVSGKISEIHSRI